MRHIVKQPEPQDLTHYKKTPGVGYAHIPGKVKTAVRDGCRSEQHGLCAYCCADLPNDPRMQRISHLVPQSVDRNLELDYSNMVTSCSSGLAFPGRLAGKGDRTCDTRQGRREIPVKPTDAGCQRRFLFLDNGGIEGAPNDQDAAETIEVLNLRAERLRRSRESAIDAAKTLRRNYSEPEWQSFLQSATGLSLEFGPAIEQCVL